MVFMFGSEARHYFRTRTEGNRDDECLAEKKTSDKSGVSSNRGFY